MAVLGRLLYRRPIFNSRSRSPTLYAANFQWPFSAAYCVGGPFAMAVLGRLLNRRPIFNGRSRPPTL